MIPFKYGTQEQYDAQVKDNSAVYFISDTKRIYRGEELIAGVQALIVQELPTFAAAVEGIIYVLVDPNRAQLFVKGERDLVSISGDVGTTSIKNVDAFAPGVVLTSVDNINDADDNTLITAGAVKAAVEDATGFWEYLDGIVDTSKVYG